VEINVSPLPDAEWERVLDTISEQAIFAAQLLDGTMPQEIETIFESAGVSLFPASARDILTECSCPDYANPCKHIAAVYYLLGEQFDLDPFLIFAMRGRSKEQIIEALRNRRAAVAGESGEGDESIETAPPVPSLYNQLADFWGSDSLDWIPPHFAAPDVEGAVLRRLGVPPGNLKKSLETLYQAMTIYVQAKFIDNDEAL
jgi:uncharacterized Zn finger protein